MAYTTEKFKSYVWHQAQLHLGAQMSPWELGLTPGTNSFFVWVPFPGSVYLIVAEWLCAGPGLGLIRSQKCKEAHFKPASHVLPGK